MNAKIVKLITKPNARQRAQQKVEDARLAGRQPKRYPSKVTTPNKKR